jgi:hypothetical protein
MLSDTDIDTCLPGDLEQHDSETIQHPARTPVDEVGSKRKRTPPSEGQPHRRLLAANSMIKIGGMTGRAMEMFNKSLAHRSIDGR